MGASCLELLGGLQGKLVQPMSCTIWTLICDVLIVGVDLFQIQLSFNFLRFHGFDIFWTSEVEWWVSSQTYRSGGSMTCSGGRGTTSAGRFGLDETFDETNLFEPQKMQRNVSCRDFRKMGTKNPWDFCRCSQDSCHFTKFDCLLQPSSFSRGWFQSTRMSSPGSCSQGEGLIRVFLTKKSVRSAKNGRWSDFYMDVS